MKHFDSTIRVTVVPVLNSKLMSVCSVLFLLACLQLQVQAQVYIPDARFRAAIAEKCPTCLIGKGKKYLDTTHSALHAGNSNTINRLFVDKKKIRDVFGIQYFKGLDFLDCSKNFIQALPDLSAMDNLDFLDCSNNPISKLPDFSKNTKLLTLLISGIKLKDFPDLNPEIEYLNIAFNQLDSLPDLSGYHSLKKILASFNNIKSFSLSRLNKNIEELDLDYNQLDTLPDLTYFVNLKKLECKHNKLTYIPISYANSKLKELDCSYNKVQKLPELHKFEYLETVKCSSNKITHIPILPISLRYIDFSDNPADGELLFLNMEGFPPGFTFKQY